MSSRSLSETDWQRIRQEFPSLKKHIFLNTATYGQLSRRSVKAMQAHLERREQFASADFLSWFDDLDKLRAATGKLIGASESDIAFITNTGHGLSLVLNGMDWQPGDEIVTLENEFPNQLYAANSRSGVKAVVCRFEDLETAVTARTRMVLLSTVNYQTGLRPDLNRMLPKLRQRGVLVYLDGTQSIGALSIDCKTLDVDFLAVDAYKWMNSANGAGFLYVREDIRKWLRPSIVGWRSDRGWRSVESLHAGAARTKDTAEKYEGGMLCFPSLASMAASIEMMLEIGPAQIEARVLQLADLVREQLRGLGAVDAPPLAGTLPSQIVSMRLPGVHSGELAAHLQRQNVHISARGEGLRISPHFYNTVDDVEAAVRAMRAFLESGK